MSRIFSALLAAAFVAAAGTGASAQVQPQWYVRTGPAVVTTDEKAELYAAGTLVPGADVSIENETTVAVEVGRFVTRNIALSLTGGFPPTFEVESAGSLSGLGRDGEIVGGPAALTAHYHLNRGGRFQPYAGAGVALMYVFDTKDGVVTEVEVDSAFGPAVQVGADYMFTSRWGAFADYKKAWISTEARGFLGGGPIRADIQLDPAVFNAGVTLAF
jgi:outer membrane protein